MNFSIACNGRGVQHAQAVSVDEQFRMVKEARVFDHFDRMPQPGQEREYLRAAERHGIPIRTVLWSYTAGRDEALLEKICAFARKPAANSTTSCSTPGTPMAMS